MALAQGQKSNMTIYNSGLSLTHSGQIALPLCNIEPVSIQHNFPTVRAT